MSQDNQTLSHEAPKTSRRALLFGIAAVGAVASPAVAASLLEAPKGGAIETPLSVPALAVADPVFELIAEHREAWDRYNEADKLHSELRDQADEDGLYDLPKIHLRDYPEKKVELVVCNDEEWHARFIRTEKMLPIFASHPADIKKSVPSGLTKGQRAYWLRKKKRELQLAEEARWERINNSECGRANEAWNDAHHRLGKVTMRLVEARPITVAGVVAAMEFWKDAADLFEDDGLWDECVAGTVEGIMANLAAALRNIVERGQA